jgi:hypothetical protein
MCLRRFSLSSLQTEMMQQLIKEINKTENHKNGPGVLRH